MSAEETPRTRRGKRRGASRMRDQGYKQVSLWFDQTEFALVLNAARVAGKPVATWVRDQAVYRAMDAQARKGGDGPY